MSYEEILSSMFEDDTDIIGSLTDRMLREPAFAKQLLLSRKRELDVTIREAEREGDWAFVDDLKGTLEKVSAELYFIGRREQRVEAIQSDDPVEISRQFHDFSEAVDFARDLDKG